MVGLTYLLVSLRPQASTSELYGGVKCDAPQKETTPFYPRSPYGQLRALQCTAIFRRCRLISSLLFPVTLTRIFRNIGSACWLFRSFFLDLASHVIFRTLSIACCVLSLARAHTPLA